MNSLSASDDEPTSEAETGNGSDDEPTGAIQTNDKDETLTRNEKKKMRRTEKKQKKQKERKEKKVTVKAKAKAKAKVLSELLVEEESDAGLPEPTPTPSASSGKKKKKKAPAAAPDPHDQSKHRFPGDVYQPHVGYLGRYDTSAAGWTRAALPPATNDEGRFRLKFNHLDDHKVFGVDFALWNVGTAETDAPGTHYIPYDNIAVGMEHNGTPQVRWCERGFYGRPWQTWALLNESIDNRLSHFAKVPGQMLIVALWQSMADCVETLRVMYRDRSRWHVRSNVHDICYTILRLKKFYPRPYGIEVITCWEYELYVLVRALLYRERYRRVRYCRSLTNLEFAYLKDANDFTTRWHSPTGPNSDVRLPKEFRPTGVRCKYRRIFGDTIPEDKTRGPHAFGSVALEKKFSDFWYGAIIPIPPKKGGN
jgi:hypothetical protein